MSKDLKMELARLPDLTHAELKKRWHSLHGREPPKGMSRPLLRQAIAYRLQEQVLGGLRPAMARVLTQFDEGKGTMSLPSSVRPGTWLLREWHGMTYEVTVLEQGVMFKGKKYRPLSEVARVITGAKWSGPAFFGLRKKSRG